MPKQKNTDVTGTTKVEVDIPVNTATTTTVPVKATIVTVGASTGSSEGQALIDKIEAFLDSRLHGPWDTIMNDTAKGMLEQLRDYVA